MTHIGELTLMKPAPIPSEAALITIQRAAVRLGTRTIWQDVTFQVSTGEFAVILGPNGAGKSTLLRLLLGLTQPDQGHVSVFDRPPRRGHPAIGYVPQRRALDPDLAIRGRDLVALGLDGHKWGFAFPGPSRRQQQ